MSGQAAIRGFTYQTIASVIQSLSRNDWEYVTVEPDTSLDKVDIQWESDKGKIYCQQVKSSINTFSKSDIITWIESMISDVPHADKFELFLIGNADSKVNEFIKVINCHDSGSNISSVIDPHLHKIVVDLVVFKMDYLESKVRDEVSRFLSNASYHLPHATVSLISGRLIYQFFQFSVLGTRVSRAEFGEHLLDWVKYNYKRDIGLETKKNKFSISFYDKPERKFVNSINPYQLQLDYKVLTEIFRRKVIELCRTISSIELPLREKPQLSLEQLRALIANPTLGHVSEADVPDYKKSFIIEHLKKWFFVSIEDSFFNVGNLKQDIWKFAMPMMGNGYEGTEAEKKKGTAINSLYWELRSIQEARTLVDRLTSYHYYILVVENGGSSHDEELTINLSIPSTVEVITPGTFYIPNDVDVLELLMEKGFASSTLGIKADSLIKEYLFNDFHDIDPMNDLDNIYKLHNGRKRLELKKEKFQHRVESMMEVEVYTDMPGFTQLRYLFKKLNPGIRMAFPSILLFNASVDFSINYDITTKHSDIVHKGDLHCLSGTKEI